MKTHAVTKPRQAIINTPERYGRIESSIFQTATRFYDHVAFLALVRSAAQAKGVEILYGHVEDVSYQGPTLIVGIKAVSTSLARVNARAWKRWYLLVKAVSRAQLFSHLSDGLHIESLGLQELKTSSLYESRSVELEQSPAVVMANTGDSAATILKYYANTSFTVLDHRQNRSSFICHGLRWLMANLK